MSRDDLRRLTVSASGPDEDEATTRHINVDNIAYLAVREPTLTATAMLVLSGAPALLGTFALVRAGHWEGLATAALVFLFIAALLYSPNEIEVGTVNDILEEEEDDPDRVESTFSDRARDHVVLRSRHKVLLTDIRYRYHFVPDNIVTVSHEPGVRINVMALIGFAISFLSALSGSIGGVVFGILVGGIGYRFTRDQPNHYVASRAPTGERVARRLREGPLSPLAGALLDQDERRGILVREPEDGPAELNVVLLLAGLVALHGLFTLSVIELAIAAGMAVISFRLPGLVTSDSVRIETKGAHEASFYMTDEDADSFLRAFEERPA